jgi:inner membrane protein
LDVFNSYGAKVLWPLYDKKIGTGLMLIFDPFLILCAGIVYWQNRIGGGIAWTGMAGFAGYLLVRQGLKAVTRRRLLRAIPIQGVCKVVLLPSMAGFFQWDFIIHGKRQIVTGCVDLLGRRAAVRDRLTKAEGRLQKKVMETALGRFFKEFAQEYHIACERKDGQHHITITDLRYYIRNRYMHHASALFDQKMELIQCAFHPYHAGRNAQLPNGGQTA